MVRGCGNQASSLDDITGKRSSLIDRILIRCRGRVGWRLDGYCIPVLAHRSDLAGLDFALALLGPACMALV